jgi:hypothetical protein
MNGTGKKCRLPCNEVKGNNFRGFSKQFFCIMGQFLKKKKQAVKAKETVCCCFNNL